MSAFVMRVPTLDECRKTVKEESPLRDSNTVRLFLQKNQYHSKKQKGWKRFKDACI